MNDCKFCNKFDRLRPSVSKEKIDTVLFESDNFIVTPTMGSLVEGWVLIISKLHFISVGALDGDLKAELEGVISETKKKLGTFFPSVFVFEHGPCSPKQTTGCGIDHLHIHILPLSFNLFEKAKRVSNFQWNEVPSIFSSEEYFKKQLPYLFIETNDNKKFISTNDVIPSQFFRRIIAAELGVANHFDWKLDYGNENVDSTLDIFSSELQPV